MERLEKTEWFVIFVVYALMIIGGVIFEDYILRILIYTVPNAGLAGYVIGMEVYTKRKRRNATYYQSDRMSVRVDTTNLQEAQSILEQKVKEPSEFKRVV